MTNWIEWACSRTLGTPETLTLVLLATTANKAGVAPKDMAWLQDMTGASPRTLQRHMKTLRDESLIDERGEWIVLAGTGTYQREFDPEQLGTPTPGPVPAHYGSRRWLQDQFDMLRHLVQQIAGLPDPGQDVEPEPEPDPILTDPLYLAMIEEGADADLAYRVASRRSNLGEAPVELEPVPAPASKGPPRLLKNVEENGLLNVLRELHHGTLTSEQLYGLADHYFDAWMALAAAENKHTVKGETEAFGLLFPAIMDAAEAWPHDPIDFMDLATNPDPKVVKPWDMSSAQTPADDAELERDIAGMLAELRKVNHPSCAVQGRASEKNAAGVVHKEPIQAYHKRVRAKWQQMKKLESMGVI